MTPKFIPGAVYESTTHGLVEFKGVDQYMGQSTLHFYSLKYSRNCYWLPDSLDMHFASSAQETSVARIPALPISAEDEATVDACMARVRQHFDERRTQETSVRRFTGPYGGDCTICGHSYDAHGDHRLECPTANR
jgi:hypothetical protein